MNTKQIQRLSRAIELRVQSELEWYEAFYSDRGQHPEHKEILLRLEARRKRLAVMLEALWTQAS